MNYIFSLYSILTFFVCCQHTVAVMVRAIARSLLGMAENHEGFRKEDFAGICLEFCRELLLNEMRIKIHTGQRGHKDHGCFDSLEGKRGF